MPARHPLQDIKTFPSLVKYLRDELDWPIETDSFEDLTFDFAPEELGLKPQEAANVRYIKQLRPLTSNQPWGIFFVSFEPKRLPVVALRKILGNLVIKKRASANKAERAAWKLHDLLFVSDFGEGDDRQITLAHFSGAANGEDIPTLKVLGWDELDTQLNLQHVNSQLHERLRWPENSVNLDAWRKQWSGAFILRHRHVITTAQELAVHLADLARKIRAKAQQVLNIESDTGPLRKLYAAFREALIHDLTEDDFADMYAQTITYGLFSAAVSRTTPGDGTAVSAENLADMVPITNPFLREMLSTFLTVGGRKGKLDFDELGIQEVVEVLNSPDTNLTAVVRNFGDRRQGEDPVIHFYEDFLKQYDKKRKVERGVFYTPQPVVSYIVRSVHELLQSEFGLQDGLADTATWGDMVARFSDLKLPTIRGIDKQTRKTVERPIEPRTPFVQILDPATGTATFLVEVIDIIHRTMTDKWQGQGKSRAQQQAAWNEYVPHHLLPRLYGYELMMAPYAIAHMKIGLKLGETGYRFQSDARARIYLTNALEPASDLAAASAANLFEALGHEAQAVNAIKRDQRFTVVVGNPPYSGISSNMTEHAQRIVDAYKIVDGEALNERKLWLQDDYVKFIRNAQTTIEKASVGVFGYITNHGYLDNPTFRGMRQSLIGTFSRLRVLDLHGNANKNEQSPDASEDKNVFDIRQGVAICLATRTNIESFVHHADLWGTREAKYRWLASHNVCDTDTAFAALKPDSPYYFFEPQNTDYRSEYDTGWKINEIMPVNSAGFITARDSLTINFKADELWSNVTDFASLPSEKAREKYDLGKDARDWRVGTAQADVRNSGPDRSKIQSVLYRPFDVRFTYYTGNSRGFYASPCAKVMGQMLAGPNIAFHVCRQSVSEQWGHVLVANGMANDCYVSNKTRERGYTHPLFIYPNRGELAHNDSPEPNFSSAFLMALGNSIGSSTETQGVIPHGVSAEDIFHYIYAVLHSPTYRSRYAEFLKIDFPRLPLTAKLGLFRALARFGGELVSLHLLESPKLDQRLTEFICGRNPEVGRVAWCNDTVWIDAPTCMKGAKQQPGTTGFSGVPEAVWDFHIGGYQVCEKWLKDRKGRALSQEDIAHYHKIVGALSETIRLMTEIDQVIDQHGGWPGAFVP